MREQCVLIVPLWNWNVINPKPSDIAASVLIVPLWNWNRMVKGCNNTWRDVLIVPSWNWNLNYTLYLIFRELVLIVPYWNWNWRNILKKMINSSFNCTIMELKYMIKESYTVKYRVLIVPSWNWNHRVHHPLSWLLSALIVPLWNWNYLKCRCLGIANWGFNCTIMELKLLYFSSVALKSALL